MRLAFQMIAWLALAAAAQTVEQCVFLIPYLGEIRSVLSFPEE